MSALFAEVNARIEAAVSRLEGEHDWPVWARVLERQRALGDRGVGDTAEHVHGQVGTDAFALWYWAVFGRAPVLNCPAELNRLFGYSVRRSASDGSAAAA